MPSSSYACKGWVLICLFAVTHRDALAARESQQHWELEAAEDKDQRPGTEKALQRANSIAKRLRPRGRENSDGEDDNEHVCCCKTWKRDMNPWWSSGLSCARKPGSRDRPGLLLHSGQICCKEREKRCDWFFGYSKPLARASDRYSSGSVAGCGGKQDASRPLLVRQDAVPDLFDVATFTELTKVHGPWHGGMLMYFGLANGGRGLATNTAHAVDVVSSVEEGIGELLADTVGLQVAPVAMGFRLMGLATLQEQIVELQRNLNLALAPEQRAYVECRIGRERKNQGLTVLLLAADIAGMAGAFAVAGPLGAAAIGATKMMTVLANRAADKLWTCRAESDALEAWLEEHKRDLGLRLQEVCEVARRDDYDEADLDCDPEIDTLD